MLTSEMKYVTRIIIHKETCGWKCNFQNCIFGLAYLTLKGQRSKVKIFLWEICFSIIDLYWACWEKIYNNQLWRNLILKASHQYHRKHQLSKVNMRYKKKKIKCRKPINLHMPQVDINRKIIVHTKLCAFIKIDKDECGSH